MHVKELGLPSCFELTALRREDSRGSFVKTFNQESFSKHGLEFELKESYFTVSKKGVIRGLHFQAPPADQAKIVYCISGSVVDVALDLREGSPTFLKHISAQLDSDRANAVFLPSGIAHGFYVDCEEATVVYNVSSVYSPENDSGVRWDSAGIDWCLKGEPIISDRDKGFAALDKFKTPFKFTK